MSALSQTAKAARIHERNDAKLFIVRYIFLPGRRVKTDALPPTTCYDIRRYKPAPGRQVPEIRAHLMRFLI